jgi:rhamnosyl/mannosyltransferase
LKIRQEIGTPFVLFIGRLINYKGLRYLITAMKGVKAKLVIIGEGPLEYELRTLAYNLDLEDRVIFLKVPYFEPLGSYIDACDLFVLPSVMRSEAFGLVLLEAMACRKPVVTTELGTGTSFVCLNGVTGIVVPPKDPKALEEAINKILNNPNLAKKFGESGRRRVEEEFGLEKMGDAFLDLYKKVLNR